MNAFPGLQIIRNVVALGSKTFFDDVRRGLDAHGVRDAVAARHTPAVFDWLIQLVPLQGISDQAAIAFSAKRIPVTWADLESDIARGSSCHRLRAYWEFFDCRYRKSAHSCAEAELFDLCVVPRLPMRNGRLSQAAVSLYLFMRDVAGGDFVGWLDDRLANARRQGGGSSRALIDAVVEPLSNVHGLGPKVVSMALADLLLASDPDRPLWIEAGAASVAVDTLVHNFFHRTGLLLSTGRTHLYGPSCYQAGGCAELIEAFASAIDARTFNPSYPQLFPRFIQHSIWRFCAESGWDSCNGRRINDRRPCEQVYCPAGPNCARIPLGPRDRTRPD